MAAVAKYTRPLAWQVVMLAALELHESGREVFSEFDLTVKAWEREPELFGLRGHAQKYPDHKRVSMEWMGQKKLAHVQLERVRQNHYRLTKEGLIIAKQLEQIPRPEAHQGRQSQNTRPIDQYKTCIVLSNLLRHQAFLSWTDDPGQPRRWGNVESFLGVADGFAGRLTDIHDKAMSVIIKCNAENKSGVVYHNSVISVIDLASLIDFMKAMVYRFPDQLSGASI